MPTARGPIFGEMCSVIWELDVVVGVVYLCHQIKRPNFG